MMSNEIFETNEQVVVAPSAEPTPMMTEAEDATDEVVGFGAFFGSTILFSVPVIGWIATIVMSFVPKRRSLKNYSRVMLLWTTLGLVLSILLFSLLTALINKIVIAPINEQFGTEFSGVFEVVKMTQDVKQGKYSTAFKHLEKQFPKEMQPLAKELATGEYDELIGKVSRGEYDEAVQELESGSHQKLEQVVGTETYDKVVSELKDASAGEKKEWLEKVEQLTNMDAASLLANYGK